MVASKRKFKVVGFEYGTSMEEEFTIAELFVNKKDYEFIYAIQEEIDKVLDMKVGETLFIDLNRDNKASKGVILRTE